MKSKPLSEVLAERLESRYDLAFRERMAMADELRRLQAENQRLKDRVSELGWQVNPDRMGQA